MARVLVVDDEALIALSTRDVLTEGHYAVVGPAYQLATAMTLAREESMDAAVLDINLSGSEVWPVAQILADRGIAFVLLSGYGSGLPVPVRFRGAPRLLKPFHDAELLAAVAESVRRTATAALDSAPGRS